MITTDRIIAIAGVITGVLAIGYAHIQYRVSQEEFQNTLREKPNVALYLGDTEISSEEIDVIFGIPPGSGKVVSAWPINLKNTGGSNAEDILLRFYYPSSILGLDSISSDLFEGQNPTRAKFDRAASRQGDALLVDYHLSHMNPYLNVYIGEPYWVQLTSIDDEFQVTTKDGLQIKTKYHVDFGINAGLAVMIKDQPPRYVNLSLHSILTSRREDLISFGFNTCFSSSENHLKRLGTLKYLQAWLSGEEENIFMLMPKEVHRINLEDGKEIEYVTEHDVYHLVRKKYPLGVLWGGC